MSQELQNRSMSYQLLSNLTDLLTYDPLKRSHSLVKNQNMGCHSKEDHIPEQGRPGDGIAAEGGTEAPTVNIHTPDEAYPYCTGKDDEQAGCHQRPTLYPDTEQQAHPHRDLNPWKEAGRRTHQQNRQEFIVRQDLGKPLRINSLYHTGIEKEDPQKKSQQH